MNTKIDCPFCVTDINGDYFNCKYCDNTGKINKEIAEKEKENIDYFNQLLNRALD